MAKKNPGIWISYDGDQNLPQQITVHGSEISALRQAIKIGGAIVWVEHGQSLDDAIAGKPTAESGAIPGEDPLPLDDDKPKRNRPSRAKSKTEEPAGELPTVDPPAES